MNTAHALYNRAVDYTLIFHIDHVRYTGTVRYYSGPLAVAAKEVQHTFTLTEINGVYHRGVKSGQNSFSVPVLRDIWTALISPDGGWVRHPLKNYPTPATAPLP